jgi:hypothetical protein
MTDVHAFLLGGLRSREGGRGVIGVARIKLSRTQGQKRREEYGDDR